MATLSYGKRMEDECEYFTKMGLDRKGLAVKYISDHKGYGLFSLADFKKGQFLLEYCGEKLTPEEGIERLKKSGENKVFFYNHGGKKWCIDAEESHEHICQFANDAPEAEANAKMKLKVFGKREHLCLFAKKNIKPGDEIVYDYGDKENLWWRKKTEVKKEKDIYESDFESDSDPFDLEEGDTSSSSWNGGYISDSEESTDYSLVKMASSDSTDNSQAKVSTVITGTNVCSKATNANCAPRSITTNGTKLSTIDINATDATGSTVTTGTIMRTIATSITSSTGVHGATGCKVSTNTGEDICATESASITKPTRPADTTDLSHSPDMEDASDVVEVLTYPEEKLWLIIASDASQWKKLTREYGVSIGFPQRDSKLVCEVTGSESAVRNAVKDIEALIENRENTKDLVLTNQQKHRRHLARDKLLACLYCGQLKRHRIISHLEAMHANELDVASLLAMNTKSEDRKHAIEIIKNHGNFQHNVKVLLGQATHFIPSRRSVEEVNMHNFLPCLHCYGFYNISELWRHVKNNCYHRPRTFDDHENSQKTSITVAAKIFLASALTRDSTDSGDMKLINDSLMKARNDDITQQIQNDSILKQLGSVLLNKLGERRRNSVIQRLRQLARLKIECKVNLIGDLINGSAFDRIVNGVKNLVSVTTNEEGIVVYKTPSLALSIGNSLKKVASVIAGDAIRRNDNKRLKEAKNVIKLMDWEWADKVSTVALVSLNVRKQNKIELLPITEDLVLLREYLSECVNNLEPKLRKNGTQQDWRWLAEATLAWLLLFNKRRGREVSMMLVSSFKNRPAWTEAANSEILNSLTKVEKVMMSRMDLVQSQGKRNKKVTTLFTPDMKRSVQTLIDTRNKFGIKETNKYIFANTQDGHLDSWQVLQKMAEEAGCTQPKLISSTKLRKYLATVCQVLMLTPNEKDLVSTHLAHDMNTHNNFYKIQEASLSLAKVSRLLVAVDDGQLSKYTGKSLDEIDISDYTPEEQEADEEESPNQVVNDAEIDSLDDEYLDNENSDNQAIASKERTPTLRIKRKRIVSEDEKGDAVVNEKERTPTLGIKRKRIVSENEKDDAVVNEKERTPTLRIKRKRIVSEDEKGDAVVNEKGIRQRWDEKDVLVLTKMFPNFKETYPSALQLCHAQKRHPCLKERTHTQIKAKLQHIRKKCV